MKAEHFVSRPALALVLGAAVAVCASGCASAAEPYNPHGVGQAQLDRVAGICTAVMGLTSDEPPIPGDGNPRLSPLENHYQGCIATLSGSLRNIDDRAAVIHEERDCRAAGARVGSAELAQCVLNAERARQATAGEARALIPTPVAVSAGVRPGSFFWIGNGEKSRRIEEACAQAGLNPAYGGFEGCVKEMKDTFYAIDNPWR